MPTVTIVLNERYKAADGQCPIVLRVEHQGKRRKIPIGYRVAPKFWDESRVTRKHPDHALINATIIAKEEKPLGISHTAD